MEIFVASDAQVGRDLGGGGYGPTQGHGSSDGWPGRRVTPPSKVDCEYRCAAGGIASVLNLQSVLERNGLGGVKRTDRVDVFAALAADQEARARDAADAQCDLARLVALDDCRAERRARKQAAEDVRAVDVAVKSFLGGDERCASVTRVRRWKRGNEALG